MESQSYGVSLAIWDHTVLLNTRHTWARPALTPAMQAGTRFTYRGGMEGWVYLVTRKRSSRESNSRPLGPESNALTTEPPSNIGLWSNELTVNGSHSMYVSCPLDGSSRAIFSTPPSTSKRHLKDIWKLCNHNNHCRSQFDLIRQTFNSVRASFLVRVTCWELTEKNWTSRDNEGEHACSAGMKLKRQRTTKERPRNS